jgi:hypothetical protein
MNVTDDELKQALSSAPPLPEGLLGAVERTVAVRRTVRRSVVSVLSAVLLAVGVLSLSGRQSAETAPATTVSDEVDQELERIGSFVNADDMDEELLSYVVLGDLE